MEFIVCIFKDFAMLIIVFNKPALKDWFFFRCIFEAVIIQLLW